MGTNYYAIPKVTEELKNQICAKVMAGDFDTAKELMPSDIHIGKSSAGWMFLFNHNDWRYYDSKESLEEFISNHIIKDEYARDISAADFWDMIEYKKFSDASEYGIMRFALNFCTSTNFS